MTAYGQKRTYNDLAQLWQAARLPAIGWSDMSGKVPSFMLSPFLSALHLPVMKCLKNWFEMPDTVIEL